jgi:carbonic anhydrase
MLSVLEYAVSVLKVEHIIVCGHYGCGGIEAALGNKSYGIINKWLRNTKEVYKIYQKEIDAIESHEGRVNALVEYNVIEQCQDVIKTSIVQKAWRDRSGPKIHGWAYGLNDGLVKELVNIEPDFNNIHPIFRFDLDELGK